jgi:hypothetical protein
MKEEPNLQPSEPFSLPFAVQDNSYIMPSIEHIARVWGDLDQEDYSHLDKR